MSTQAIRNFIDEVGDRCPELRDMALAELEAIERAACDVLNEEMESADPAEARDGMARYKSACTLFEAIAKDAK